MEIHGMDTQKYFIRSTRSADSKVNPWECRLKELWNVKDRDLKKIFAEHYHKQTEEQQDIFIQQDV